MWGSAGATGVPCGVCVEGARARRSRFCCQAAPSASMATRGWGNPRWLTTTTDLRALGGWQRRAGVQVETQHDLVVEDIAGANEPVLLVEGHRRCGTGHRAREQHLRCVLLAKHHDDGVDGLGAVAPPLEPLINQKLPQ